jgi:hypothetical protein
MPKSDDSVFSVLAHGNGTAPVIAIGLTPKAWNNMLGEHTRIFDLSKIGIPIRIMIFGAESVERATEILQNAAKDAGVELEDRRGTDFSIGEKHGDR